MARDNKILLLISIVFLSTPIINVSLVSFFELPIFNTIVPLLRDILVFVLLLSILRIYSSNYKIKANLFYLFLIALIYIIQGLLFSESSKFGIIINVRRIFTPILIFIIGYHLNFTINYFYQLLKIIVGFLLCFGILEMVLNKTIWLNFFNLPLYWSNNIQDLSYSYDYEGSARLYTPDFFIFTGEKYRRMISFFLEPSTLGTFFSNAFALFYKNKNIKNSYFFSFLCLVGGLLCFSKIFLLTLLSLLLFSFFLRKISHVIVPLTLIMSIYLGYFVFESLGLVHGSLSHVIGLYTGFKEVISNPFGLGLGMGGNRPGLDLNGIVNGLWGGESGLGNILIQSTVFGLLFIYFFHRAFIFCTKNDFLFKNQIFYLTFILWLNFLFSASSLGLSGNFLFIILLGYIYKKNRFDKKDYT